MGETAADQLRRILHVIPRVADGEEHPVDELAQLAGVDLPTLIADLNSLAQRFDAPGGFVEGVQIFIDEHTVSVMASHFLRPMRLTMPELCALELGLAILRAERVDADHSAIDRAIARLRQAITRLPSNDTHEGLRHADLSATADPAHLNLIRAALRSRRKVRLAYRRADRGEVTERLVCPYSLFFWSGMWYIVAHCEENVALRFYRIDRVTSVTPTDEAYGIPDDFRLEAVLRDGRPLGGEPQGVMRVRYGPRIARWIAEREGKTPDEDGSLVLEHPIHDLHWAMRHVLQYGPDAEVLTPESLRHALARQLEAMSTSS